MLSMEDVESGSRITHKNTGLRYSVVDVGDEEVLLSAEHVVALGLALDIGPVRLHIPRAAVIGELRVEDLAQLLAKLRGLDRSNHLDALLEVALHAVR